MYLVFYFFFISFISAYAASYQSMESVCMDHAQRCIPRLNNVPPVINMDDSRQEAYDCRGLGKKIVSGLAFLFCCSKKKNDECQYLRSEDTLSVQTCVSDDVQRNEPFDAVQRMRNKGLLDLLKRRTSDIEALERAVLVGADPWGCVSDDPGESLSPLLYAVQSLGADGVSVRDWSYKIHAILNAHRLREEQFMRDERYEQRCDAVLQMHHAVRLFIGEFGMRQDVHTFEQYGPLWGEICWLLGIDMTSMRVGVFSLLKKKDISEAGDYIIRKTLQTQFGSFERFALACAVHDFVYCLAFTIATNKVYDMGSFCRLGVPVRADPRLASFCKVDAERIRVQLNEGAKARLNCMIASLTMRAGL